MTALRRHLLVWVLLLTTIESKLAHEVENECVVDNESDCKDYNHAETNATVQHDDLLLDCGLYMAPSSIPNAGWGLYAGKTFSKGDMIEPLDLAIQMEDILKHMPHIHNDETRPDWLFNRYIWMPRTTGAKYDGSDMSIIPGLGAMTNNHPAFTNIVPYGVLRKQLVHRDSPQAGAFTEYKSMAFMAKQDIPIGHELSIEDGRFYSKNSPISSRGDFKMADKLLKKLVKICKGDLETHVCKELWQRIRHDKYSTEEDLCGSFLVNEKECNWLWKQLTKSRAVNYAAYSKIINALPETLEGAKEALDQGCAWYLAPNARQSIKWLQENGVCLDHIEPRDESTIPLAGSGAFAKRRLPKGSLVAPAPVLHLHRERLDLFLADAHDPSKIYWKGQQLMLNYAYGHPSTSLLFVPFSPVVNYINHSPTPNVELRWSSQMPHPKWMNLITDEIVAESQKSGLMMEFVAVRDIEEGEEILLDYGRDWQAAWENHVNNWQAPLHGDKLQPVESYIDQTQLPTRDDWMVEPLASNVMTLCWIDEDQLEYVNKEEFIWMNSTDTTSFGELYLCTLISRYVVDGTFVYDADVKLEKGWRINGIHRRGIQVVGRPYTSNQYLRQSFRHEIHVPDNMIAEAWKVQEVEESSSQKYTPKNYLNDYTLPIRTETEQASRPYADTIWIGCYHGLLPQQSGVETKWEYTSGVYELAAANLTRCDILERHGDDAGIADSIHPAIQNYTVRVWPSKDASWVLTGVPRRAIEFFDKELSPDISVDGLIRNEVGLTHPVSEVVS